MADKIYTRTGDQGKTSLLGGTRVLKDHPRIEAYGTVDELNSCIGLVSAYLSDTAVISLLREIQDRLFTIGSALACDPHRETKMMLPLLEEEDVALLEKTIDEMNAVLPPLRSFLLPGGDTAVSTCHIARCVCRRAERLCVTLLADEADGEQLILRYLNRLSDYLFVLARFVAHQRGVPEILWPSGRQSSGAKGD